MRLFLPGILISLTNILTSKYCNTLEKSAVNVPGRPPGWVFAIVWPLLYLTTGFAWQKSKMDLLFSMIIGLCCSWLYVYSCMDNKELSTLVLMSASILSWKVVYKLDNDDKKLMIPLAIWTMFATYLNAYQITYL
jgi:tryptophan-rich sensory protein